jgi:acetyl-CoA carboxylase biotin carboxyl carrier protein
MPGAPGVVPYWGMPGARKEIDALAGLMDEFGLRRAAYKREGLSIEFAHTPLEPEATPLPAVPPTRPADAPAQPSPVAGTPVPSPAAGIFYNAPSPGEKPFVAVGDTVNPGDVIGLIEAMKVFNEIATPVGGTVVATPAQNGQLVQPGDPLIVLQ